MLIQFSAGNFRSFKDVATLSMVASALTEHETAKFTPGGNLELLKSSVIYGANGSGKSNFLQAMGFMINFVINSSKETQANEPIAVDSFKLATESEKKPAFFEMVFLVDGKRYRYGFEVDGQKVHSEWLFYSRVKAEKLLFSRDLNAYDVTQGFIEGQGLEKRTRDNALFLSVVAQFNGQIAQSILNWFSQVNVLEAVTDEGSMPYTMHMLEKKDNAFREYLVELLKAADLGIEDVTADFKTVSHTDLPKDMPEELKRMLASDGKFKRVNILTSHKKFEHNKFDSFVDFEMGENESGGTKKVFALSGPVYDTLRHGKVLVVDELDARLHPAISEAIVRLFLSPKTNKSNAQLIFCTHNVSLLTNKIFRRDQIWFTEKDRFGASKLFSLADYRVRKDATFNKDYLRGRYGAIPSLGDLDKVFH